MDCDAAWRLVCSFTNPAAVIIKHNNPCGVSEADVQVDAFRRAFAADSVSAFGGIVGFNRSVDGETAQELSKLFLECVIAPGYHPEARDILGKKNNLRLLEQPTLLSDPYEWDIRRISGGFLVQEQDSPRPLEMKVVSRRSPSPEEQMSLGFAWQVAKHVKSNAIVLARGRVTAAVGAGQMSRIDSLKVAHMKLSIPAIGTKKVWPLVMASDGFFPFRDTVDEAAKMGVSAIIQPGGSVRDEESVTAANEHGLAMVITSVRHFRH
jgi:phosphoribosylaminoimidazolecarboxamide formyltransferase/IMP cyclohydrolase